MERVSIQEIAAVLCEKNGLKRKDAEIFATTLFDVVKEGLTVDRIVKIKGLGTFKIIDIEARESINVNTGERVLIEGHDKITFTPDNTMKLLVNRPFSQFETVVLNDGVDFEDTAVGEEEPENDEVSEEEVPVAESIEEDSQAPILEFCDSETLEEDEEPEKVEEPEKPVRQEEPEEEVEPEKVEEPEQPEEPEVSNEIEKAVESEEPEEELPVSNRPKFWWWILALAACICSFVGGYFFGKKNALTIIDLPEEVVMATDSTEKDSAVIVAPIVDTPKVEQPDIKVKEVAEKKDTPVVATPKPVDASPKPAEAAPKPAEPVAKPKEAALDKYEQMDSRVRTGAYRIVGLDQTVKVKAGETLQRISRRTLGPDMECYIKAYNGISSNAALKEGQSIKIPKLELKKKKKKSNN